MVGEGRTGDGPMDGRTASRHISFFSLFLALSSRCICLSIRTPSLQHPSRHCLALGGSGAPPPGAASIYQRCVIETCAPSLSAKRLADCLHFHTEGCDGGGGSVAALIAIDWDPSHNWPTPSPPTPQAPNPSGKSFPACLRVRCDLVHVDVFLFFGGGFSRTESGKELPVLLALVSHWPSVFVSSSFLPISTLPLPFSSFFCFSFQRFPQDAALPTPLPRPKSGQAGQGG